MSMDSMPDDCLLHIFDSIHDTQVLFRCLRVCKRWNRLVNYRLAKVERLLDEHSIKYTKLDEKSLCYYPKHRPLMEPILSQILKKSPKLKVVSVGLEYSDQPLDPEDWAQRSIDRLSKHESLEGLILSAVVPEEIDVIPQSIQLLSSSDTCIRKGYYPRVKQLIVEDDIFIDSIHRFPNIERLNLKIYRDHTEWYEVACKNQYIFKNLKLLEIDTSFEVSMIYINYASRFIDFCPQLESAHLRIAIDQMVPDDNFRHKNLTNLVISYVDFDQVEDYVINLIYLLKRFPNVKHLAIKYDTYYIDSKDDSSSTGESESDEAPKPKKPKEEGINGEALPYIIVDLLKKLVLLDMRNIIGIDKTSADHVQRYCEHNKRSIKFYFGSIGNNEIKCDWPELFTDERQDSRELNFMKDFFLLEYPINNFRLI